MPHGDRPFLPQMWGQTLPATLFAQIPAVRKDLALRAEARARFRVIAPTHLETAFRRRQVALGTRRLIGESRADDRGNGKKREEQGMKLVVFHDGEPSHMHNFVDPRPLSATWPLLLLREGQAPLEEHAGRGRSAEIGDAEARGGVKGVHADDVPRGEGR